MHKIYTIIISCFLIQSGGWSQTYYSGWDTADETSGWTQYKKGDAGLYEWTLDPDAYSPDNAIAHYYPVGGDVPTDDWYVSPMFNFDGGGSVDTLWKKFSGFGTPMAGDSIALFLLNGSSDPDLAVKTILYSFTDSSYTNDGVWRKDTAIIIPATEGESYLAFRYYTTANWLDVKFDNLSVSYTPTSGLNKELPKPDLKLYPIPTSDMLVIEVEEHISSKVYQFIIINQMGQVVNYYSEFTGSIDVSSFENGLYHLIIQTESGSVNKTFQVHH